MKSCKSHFFLEKKWNSEGGIAEPCGIHYSYN